MTENQILVVPPITQQFTCNATGAPSLEIVWSHKDRLIQGNSDKYSIKTVVVSTNTPLMALHSVLTINNSTPTDSGPVTCEARISFRQDGSFVTLPVSSRSNLVVLVEMTVEYLDGISNRNGVRLICKDETLRRVSDAEFQKNGTLLSQGPGRDQVTSLVEGNGEVTFTFTQGQEGFFRCIYENVSSSEIGLAGNVLHVYYLVCTYSLAIITL